MNIFRMIGVVCVLAFSQQSASAGMLHENQFSMSWAPIESQDALEKVPSQTLYIAVSNDFQRHLKPNEIFHIRIYTLADFHEKNVCPHYEVYFREDGTLCVADGKKPGGFLFPSENHLDAFVVCLTDVTGQKPLFIDYFIPRPKIVLFDSGAMFSSALIYKDRRLGLGRLYRLPKGKDLSGELSVKRNGEIATKCQFRTGGETIVDFKIPLEKEGNYTFELSLADETIIYDL